MKTRFFVTLVALFLSGCATTGGSAPSLQSAPQPQWLDTRAVLTEVAPFMPADTEGLVVVDMDRMLNAHLKTAFGLLKPDWDSKAMMADMSKIMIDRLGLDLTKARWAVAGGTEAAVIMFVGGPIGAPTASKQTISGLSVFHLEKEGVYAIPLKNNEITAFCSTQEEIGQLAALAAGEQPSLTTAKASMKTLDRMLGRAGDGDLAAAWMVEDLEEETLAEVPMGLADETTAVAFSVSDRLVVVIQGAPESLAEKRTKIDAFIKDARQELAKSMNDTAEKDTAEALATVYAFHISGELAKELTPALEKDLLVYDVSMDMATHPVTIIGGVGAAIYLTFSAVLEGMAAPMMQDAPIPQN